MTLKNNLTAGTLAADGIPPLLRGQIVDYFAGGGGASTGIEQALGRSPDVAINHCEHAVRVHELNHPDTKHLRVSVWDVDPVTDIPPGPVDLAWFSPDCSHFSRAKGGKPLSRRVRGLAWVTCRVAGRRRPQVIVLENVPEFQDWGPVRKRRFGKRKGKVLPVASRRGETFRTFVGQLESLGYQVEWRVLNAADYGAPTLRRRLFLVARCDGQPIQWPEPTHGPGRPQPYRTAAECIDWSIPTQSIFGRKKPLAEATLRRIAEGIRRFVIEAERPFVVQAEHQIIPSLIHMGNGERAATATTKAQRPRALDIQAPLTTITAGGNHHALVEAFVARHYGGPRPVVGQPVDRPLSTITTRDHHSLVACAFGDPTDERANRVAALLIKYYGQGNGQALDEPLHTIVTKARFGLVTLELAGETYALVDIGMRMLTPKELAGCQGFPADFKLVGSQADQIARIGHSVCPPLARALVAANVGALTA